MAAQVVHMDIGARCIGHRFADSREITNYCYLLNRVVFNHYKVELPPQRRDTLEYEVIFNNKPRNLVFNFIGMQGFDLVEKLNLKWTKPRMYTKKVFDDYVASLLEEHTPVNDCTCVFTYVSFNVALAAVHFAKGDVPEAADWAYYHMVRIGITTLIRENLAQRNE